MLVRMQRTGSLIQGWWESKMELPLSKTVWQFPIKLNMQLPHGPAVVLLNIYSREVKTYDHTKICT